MNNNPLREISEDKIVHVTSGDPLRDVMDGAARWHMTVPPGGFVSLVDVMPRLVPHGSDADYRVVQAARTSYGNGTKTSRDDAGLLRYLLRNRHTSPFEMVRVLFHVKAPIFVARQWVRHRMCSWNELSGRYSEMPDEFWMPTQWRGQGVDNKQGSDGAVEYFRGEWRAVHDTEAAAAPQQTAESVAFAEYHRRLKAGVSREMARSCLPLSTYTEWYWLIDTHNLMHFLSLRLDHHAQKEIRDFGQAIFTMLHKLMPTTVQAFVDFHPNLGAMNLTLPDIEAIQNGVCPTRMTKREHAELVEKCSVLGVKPPAFHE